MDYLELYLLISECFGREYFQIHFCIDHLFSFIFWTVYILFYFFHFSVFRFVLMAQSVIYLDECSVCKRIHIQLLGEVLYKC